MKKSRFFLIAMAFVAFSFFSSCDMLQGVLGNGSENGSGSGGAPLTQEALQGTWVATGKVQEGGQEVDKAMLIDFSGEYFAMIAYSEKENEGMTQALGAFGSFTIGSDALALEQTLLWSDAPGENQYKWVPPGPEDPPNMSIPYVYDDTTLTLSLPMDDPPIEAPFTKKTFSWPTALVGSWKEEDPHTGTIVFGINSEQGYDYGEYNYTAGTTGALGEGNHSGYWFATETETENMIRITTVIDDEAGTNLEHLANYKIEGEGQDATLIFSWEETDFITFTVQQ